MFSRNEKMHHEEYLVLFALVYNALKLVIVSVWLGLIRLAWDLNLLSVSGVCLHQCHYTSTSYSHSLMRLYEIFKPLPGGAHSVCVCVCVRVFLHIPESVSALFDLSLSTDRYSETNKRQTDTRINLSTPADRHDLSQHNDLLFQNLLSQLMRSPG